MNVVVTSFGSGGFQTESHLKQMSWGALFLSGSRPTYVSPEKPFFDGPFEALGARLAAIRWVTFGAPFL